MTKHDEARQILHEAGFKFKDGRIALDMTDEEVDQFFIEFFSKMAELGRKFATTVKPVVESFGRVAQAVYEDMGWVLAEVEKKEPQ